MRTGRIWPGLVLPGQPIDSLPTPARPAEAQVSVYCMNEGAFELPDVDLKDRTLTCSRRRTAARA